MAIKLPYIPEIESASDLLNLCTNSKKLAERMALLLDLQKNINDGLAQYEGYKSVEAYKDQVDGELAAARHEKAEIQRYVKVRKAAADKAHASADERITETIAFGERIHAQADSKTAELSKWEADLHDRERAINEKLAEVANAKAIVDNRLKEANQIRAEYEQKLADVRKLVA